MCCFLALAARIALHTQQKVQSLVPVMLPLLQQGDISFWVKLALGVGDRWQESGGVVCCNTAHSPAASVKSSPLASGHTLPDKSTHWLWVQT